LKTLLFSLLLFGLSLVIGGNCDGQGAAIGLLANRQSRGREVYAVWYNVPADSLARRRAGKNELTAAHNRLPLGTLLRVTNILNGKIVTVRVTDRGITNRRAKIDLCREAAEQLGIVRQGIARVRMDIVPEPATGADITSVAAP
jgi:rare lipoprotein A (peptidoglycan hydrolase)